MEVLFTLLMNWFTGFFTVADGREVSARFVSLYVFATGVILTFEGRFLWFFIVEIQTMA